MDNTLFESLIAQPESRHLDFKETSYHFHNDKELEDAKFIKDILSFSNTIRKESGYIIAGIKEADDKIQLLGIDNFIDDATFQQKAMDKIWPKPIFLSYKFKYKEKVFGIIEIPVFAYDRPLVATKQMKGIEVDKVYLRRGSSNSTASASEILSVIDWLQSLKLSDKDKLTLQEEVNGMITFIMDKSKPLSSTLSQFLTLAKKVGNPDLERICANELTGYSGKTNNNPEIFGFRILKVPATPYEVSFPPYQNSTPDQMIAYLLNREGFREVRFFYHYSLLELESLIENALETPSMVTLKFPTEQVFPDIKSSVPKSTIFMGPRMLRDLYLAIRNELVRILVSITLN